MLRTQSKWENFCLGTGRVADNTCGMLVALHGMCHAAVIWHLLPGKTGYNRITPQLLLCTLKKNMRFIFTSLKLVTWTAWTEVRISWRLFGERGVSVKSLFTAFVCALLSLSRETVVAAELLVTGVCCGSVLSRRLLFYHTTQCLLAPTYLWAEAVY